MASPAPCQQDQSAKIGQKRKREPDDVDRQDDEVQDDDNAIVEPSSLIPDDFEPSDDDDEDDDDGAEAEADHANVIEENTDIPTHDESQEPFPKCATYDDQIEEIEESITSVPRRVLDQLSEHECLGKAFKAHVGKAEKLRNLPQTPKIRIAILGCAGTGKSSLLNSITGKADLAKSLSGGQSCTCVPTEYRDALPGQSQDFSASFQYLNPKGVKRQLEETIKDYNTFAFEAEDDWDEETRTSAKKAHAYAIKMLRTLSNDLPNFNNKASIIQYLAAKYKQDDSPLLDELVVNCETKLKEKTKREYREYREAKTLAKLRTKIDPLMSSSGLFEEPFLWPLLRNVVIGVRDSRVLEKVTLIDLPGISDTNQSRVELTHEYIGGCDYVWIVSPIIRVVDDGVAYQLISRYGKLFKGMVCVICTHSDDGILGAEANAVNHLREEDRDVKPYGILSDRMKAKTSEIVTLKTGIAKIRKKKKKATKDQMESATADELVVKKLTRELAGLEAERFSFLVHARNELITEQLQEVMQSNMPLGQVLEVHCVSNSHYAALNRNGIRGPRLNAEATGTPNLRASTMSLMAPRLLTALEQYITFDVKVMLQDLQLWLSTTSIDRRPELLGLASSPGDGLAAKINARLSALASETQSTVEDRLQQAIPAASDTALKQLAKKENRHWQTLLAFIRRHGNYATKMCPKESWNENFSKTMADVAVSSLTSLSQTRDGLTEAFKSGVIEDLNQFKQSIDAFPALLPKQELASSIETYIGGIRHAFRSDETEYEKDIRKILLDATQDTPKNPFSRRMRPVYNACMLDKGTGITRRSIGRIRESLSNTGDRSPFAGFTRVLTRWLNAMDKYHVEEVMQPAVAGILTQLYEAMEELLSDKVEDEVEVAARADLQQLVPALLVEWEQTNKDLQAVKAKY